MILSGSMFAICTASLTWRSKHLGPVLVIANLIAWGFLLCSGCSVDRCTAMLLVSRLDLISALCEQMRA